MHPSTAAAAAGAVSLRPTQPLKRKWAQPLWERFFACLLNHTGAHTAAELGALE